MNRKKWRDISVFISFLLFSTLSGDTGRVPITRESEAGIRVEKVEHHEIQHKLENAATQLWSDDLCEKGLFPWATRGHCER